MNVRQVNCRQLDSLQNFDTTQNSYNSIGFHINPGVPLMFGIFGERWSLSMSLIQFLALFTEWQLWWIQIKKFGDSRHIAPSLGLSLNFSILDI